MNKLPLKTSHTELYNLQFRYTRIRLLGREFHFVLLGGFLQDKLTLKISRPTRRTLVIEGRPTRPLCPTRRTLVMETSPTRRTLVMKTRPTRPFYTT